MNLLFIDRFGHRFLVNRFGCRSCVKVYGLCGDLLRGSVLCFFDSLCDGRILIGIGSYDLARGYSAEYADGRHHCGTDSQQQIFFHIFLQSAAASSVCGLIYCYI